MDKKIILLNGPSSSGKSTLARALKKKIKEKLNREYLIVSIDDHMKIAEDETIYEDDVWEISGEMCGAVRHGLEKADGAIVDHVITSGRIYEQFMELTDTAPVLKVRVTCPIDVLLKREQRRGNRAAGSAQASYDYLYPKDGYDITVDTSLRTAEGCAGEIMDAMDLEALPRPHVIDCDPSLDTLDDELGADAFAGSLDHADSRYYRFNDFYDMESGDGLHIIPHFKTYQQTTEYSCGAAAALMVLEHYGCHGYNEMQICEAAGTHPSRGTTVEGLTEFFRSIGWNTECHADTKKKFETIEECRGFFIEKLNAGTPVMFDWVDWAGHWQVLIGLDTCGTDDPYDDVLIIADPYDVTDHFQDGYYTVPLGRFFQMWREGPCADKDIPYEQPYVTAVPPGNTAKGLSSIPSEELSAELEKGYADMIEGRTGPAGEVFADIREE